VIVHLPFPPASLSGHAKGHWRGKSGATKHQREYAAYRVSEVIAEDGYTVPAHGDIPIHFHFIPGDRRGDRVNFPIRIKATIDGIADALGVNDNRFLPSYSFGDPSPRKPRVEVTI
jgi:crossover junction endodeoxyribonuclease RusA